MVVAALLASLFGAVLAHQPPINVIVNVHIEPFETELGDTVSYTTRIRELCWLRDVAASYGAPLSVQSTGEFMEYVVDSSDQGELVSILALGGDIGTHVHPNYWRYARHDWRLFAPVEYIYTADPETVWQVIQMNKVCVDSAIGAENNRTIAPFFREFLPEIMDSFGFYQIAIMELNQEIEAESVLYHYPWNPWQVRLDPLDLDDLLRENLSQPYVQIPLLPEAHPWCPTDPPFWKRRFLMLYIEWLAQIRHGTPQKVWVISWLAHPRAIQYRHDDHTEILQWLSENFVGHTTPFGDTIARFASAADVAQEYYAWRSANPSASSFNFTPGGPYPYTYPTLRRFLWGTEFDSNVDIGAGCVCFRFVRRDEAMVPRDTVFVAWRWTGETTVDFCPHAAGWLLTENGLGDTSIVSCDSVVLTPEPLIIAPTDSIWAVAETRTHKPKTMLSASPNPFNSGCVVKLPPGARALSVFNSKGELVTRISVPAGATSVEVELSTLRSGLYILRADPFAATTRVLCVR